MHIEAGLFEVGRSAVVKRDDAKAPAPPIDRRQVVLFRLAEQAYALPIHAIQEIVPMAQLSQPPALPHLLAGFLNLRGTAVPVVRLARLLGCPEQAPGLYTPLLIMQSGRRPLALWVDAVTGMATIEDSNLVAVQENFCVNDCALGLARLGESHVVVLSDERLLREQEQRRLAELSLLEQQRLVGLEAPP